MANEIEEGNKTDVVIGKGCVKERLKTAEQLLLELDNDEDDETEEMSDTVSLCGSSDSDTDLDNLNNLNDQATEQLDRDNLLFDEKLVCEFVN